MFKHKKNPRKTRWTKAFRKAAGKELTVDASFQFEKRRNTPVKYDRQLWSDTVKAIKRIEEIKQKRQANYVMKRLRRGRVFERERDLKEVKRDLALIKSPAAGIKRNKNKGKVIVTRENDDEMESEDDTSEDEQMQQTSEDEEEALLEAN